MAESRSERDYHTAEASAFVALRSAESPESSAGTVLAASLSRATFLPHEGARLTRCRAVYRCL